MIILMGAAPIADIAEFAIANASIWRGAKFEADRGCQFRVGSPKLADSSSGRQTMERRYLPLFKE
jgi:hypothetical protein